MRICCSNKPNRENKDFLSAVLERSGKLFSHLLKKYNSLMSNILKGRVDGRNSRGKQAFIEKMTGLANKKGMPIRKDWL